MRVALVNYYYPEYTISLANALCALGVQVLLLLPDRSWAQLEPAVSFGIERVSLKHRRVRDPLNGLEIWRAVQRLSTWHPDVIHIQHGHPWFNLCGLPFLKRQRLVTTVHDVTSHAGDRYSQQIPQWVWDLGARRAAHLIVHGELLKAQLAQRQQLSPDRIHVIPHGEFSLYARWAEPDQAERNEVLFFGRIWPYKGLRYLIEAEPLITAKVPEARIVIAGEGEQLTNYTPFMTHRELFDIHNRFIPQAEVAGFFQRAAVVVLPYTEASQSGVIPLAYAFGKPVVATRVGSLPEVVEDGITGYLVPPRDVPQLAEAVIHLLKDQSLRHQMGRQAYQKAMTDLAWSRIAEETLKVYEVARSPDRGDL
jgi:glycosyltransferase involved in cell wall biosynthesis